MTPFPEPVDQVFAFSVAIRSRSALVRSCKLIEAAVIGWPSGVSRPASAVPVESCYSLNSGKTLH